MEKKRPKHMFTVKVYELNNIREVSIDLNSGKDRAKLKHIIAHEGYRLRKRDISRYKNLLNDTKR